MRITTKRAECLYQILVLLAATLLLSGSFLAADGGQSEQAKSSSATNQSAVGKLEVGKPIERELKGGELHTYEVALTKDQYLNVVVDQRGIDVVVQVIALDGKQILEVDSPNGDKGPEPVELIAEASGNYTLNVRSLEKDAPIGKYEIKIITLHAATDNDRVSAERAIAPEEAKKLSIEAEQLHQAGKYDEGLPLAERALAIREKALGADHPLVAASLNSLALLYHARGDYAKAESLYVRLFTVFEKELSADHPSVATLLNNLALLYYAKGDYEKAEPLFVRALSMREKTLGTDHPDVASSLNHLAELYRKKGNYTKAEPLLVRAVEINEKALGADDVGVAVSLNNLALLYDATGDYAKAEPLYVRALAIREKALGAEHPYIATSLNNLATLYSARGDYVKAEPLYQRALAIQEKALGPDHPNVATSLNNLAELYGAKGDSAKAEPLCQRALTIYEKALGPDHPGVAQSLNNLAGLYRHKGEYVKAERLYLRALTIREKALGPDHANVATSLNDLAELYRDKGDYAKAEPLYQRALTIYEKALGPDHPSVATSLNNLAVLYGAKGDYAKAEPLYQRALAIQEKSLGPDHPSVATSLNNLAVLYGAKGDYAKAEPLYQRALAIQEKALGPDHPSVATDLNNLAELYRVKGDYAKVEPLYQRALAIYEKALGPDHPRVATSLNNLALLHRAKGDYAKAEPLYQRALAIDEKALGPDHPDVATSLNNLAELYRAKGDYGKAEPLYQRSLAIKEKALGPAHPDVATLLNSLAVLYSDKGDDAKAEPLYQRALTIREKALGPDHHDVATSLNNLAVLYNATRDYAKAEPLYLRALAIYEKALGPDHPFVANSLNNLAGLFEAKSDINAAIALQTKSTNISERNISINLASGSERQKLAYLATFSSETYRVISLHVSSAPGNTDALRLALTTVLRRKGRALDAMSDSFALLRRQLKPADQALLDQLSQSRARLSKLLFAGPDKLSPQQYKSEIDNLQQQVEQLEGQISSRSAEFRAQSQPVSIEAIQAAIPVGRSLVEFVSFDPFNPKQNRWEDRRYLAYILSNKGEPRWVDLGKAQEIDNAIAALRSVLRKDGSKPLSDIEQEVKPLARRLDQLVMQPVRKQLGQTRFLLISPDGALNLVPFAALVDEQNHFLVENYSISYLTSGRDLLRLQTHLQNKQGSVVIADPDFDYPAKLGHSPGPKFAGTAYEPLRQLKATQQEASELKAIFPNAEVVTQQRATKAYLKGLSSPLLLHVATHGFFLEDQPDQKRLGPVQAEMRLAVRRRGDAGSLDDGIPAGMKLENPLLRSGLFLTGANAGGGKGEEGIVTALDASGLDLWGTKLVVLSACDTGVGEIKDGEGVYGLRRALVLAGSETQVMSLWPVSDTGTGELMVEYYKGLKAGQGRSEALRQVQLTMLANPLRRHPFYWASFIQSGEWANLDGKR